MGSLVFNPGLKGNVSDSIYIGTKGTKADLDSAIDAILAEMENLTIYSFSFQASGNFSIFESGGLYYFTLYKGYDQWNLLYSFADIRGNGVKEGRFFAIRTSKDGWQYHSLYGKYIYVKGATQYTETISSGDTFTATKDCIFMIRFYNGFCGLSPLDTSSGICGSECNGWNGSTSSTTPSSVSINLKKNAQCKIWLTGTIKDALIYDV